jgi:TonB family protein
MPMSSFCAPLLIAFLQVANTAQTPNVPAPAPQAVTSTTLANSPTPSDPRELLETGRKVNGLTGPDMQPWHLRASYEVFDDVGKSKYKGNYEEWWVSEKQYKRSYQSPEFTQMEYGTESGPLRTGDTHWVGGPVSLLRSALVDPLPGPEQLNNTEPAVADKMFGNTKLRCVSINHKIPHGNAPQPIFPSYCFDLEKPVLRSNLTFNNIYAILFNRVVLFQGRYLGGDVGITHLGKDYLKIHLDQLEPLPLVNAADFQPPADAIVAAPRRISVSDGVSAGNILTKVQPEYPLEAFAQHIQGTVAMQAIISKSGHITSLSVISGPTELQNAAIEAVRQWAYKPYLLNGEAVEVGTTINVVFSLASR